MIGTMDNHPSLYTQAHENLCQGIDQCRAVHAQQHVFRIGRVGQRPQDIEHGSDSQLLSDRSDIFHGRMVFLCENETETDFLQHLPALVRILLDIDPQSFEAVRRSRQGGGCAVSVLCYLDACCREDEGCRCGYVEAVRIVPARTNDLHDFHPRVLQTGRFLSHRHRTS